MITTAVWSALTQTSVPSEVIVVDDASDDETLELLKRIKNPRVRVIGLEQKVGGAAARNMGVAAAKSDFVAFLDSDDWWLPRKLEFQLQSLRDSGAQVVYCRSYSAYGELAVREASSCYEGDVLAYLAGGWCPPTTSSFVISRALFRMVEFDEQLVGLQDYDLWVQLALNDQPFSLTDLPLTVFVQHRGQRVSRSMTQRLRALDQVYAKWIAEFSARSFGDRFERAIEKWRWLTKFAGSVDAPVSSTADLLRTLLPLPFDLRTKCRYAAYVLLGPSLYEKRLRHFVRTHGVDLSALRSVGSG